MIIVLNTIILYCNLNKIHCIGGFLHGVVNIWAVQASLSDQACHAHYITIWEQSYFASIRWFVFGKSQTPKMVCLRNTKSWWRDRMCFILDSKLPPVMMMMMLVKVARMSSIPVWKLPVDMRIPSVHSRLSHIHLQIQFSRAKSFLVHVCQLRKSLDVPKSSHTKCSNPWNRAVHSWKISMCTARYLNTQMINT